MKKVFITSFDQEEYQPRDLFPLSRLLLQATSSKLSINKNSSTESNFNNLDIKVTPLLSDADFVVISEPLNHQFDKKKYQELELINKICSKKNILIYLLISGDYGKVFPPFSNVIYYRMGGFKTQLDEKNRAFFPLLSDHLKLLFNQDDISLREKKERPTVGFCGHASPSISKYLYEKSKLALINGQRLLAGDFNFEPLFASAFERYKILASISRSSEIKTNFLFRNKYRAGAITEEERHQTTIEYFRNIIESDYIVCLRGSGNFSVRLFETLLMGRIPVFINTDCLLPLEDEIDWKKHVVWVEWKERDKIAEIIANFHKNITIEEFVRTQKNNREIWMSHFNVRYYLQNLLKFENAKKFKSADVKNSVGK